MLVSPLFQPVCCAFLLPFALQIENIKVDNQNMSQKFTINNLLIINGRCGGLEVSGWTLDRVVVWELHCVLGQDTLLP